MNTADQERQQPESTDDEQEPDYRFTLANERTFLAWIRTALALIAGGVAVAQLVRRSESRERGTPSACCSPPEAVFWRRWQSGAGSGCKPRYAEMQSCHRPGFRHCSAAPSWL
jgi:hypothetical protein